MLIVGTVEMSSDKVGLIHGRMLCCRTVSQLLLNSTILPVVMSCMVSCVVGDVLATLVPDSVIIQVCTIHNIVNYEGSMLHSKE